MSLITTTLTTLRPYFVNALKATYQYTGVPQNPSKPLSLLAASLDLDKRIALAFGGMIFATALTATALTAAGITTLQGTYRFVTCQPIKAIKCWGSAAVYTVVPVGVYLIAQKIL